MADDFRYQDIAWPKTDAKEFIFDLIGPRSRVLDLGCWTGRLGEKLKRKKRCFAVGVDISEKALEIAKKRLDKVFKINLEHPHLLRKYIKEKFDFVVLADVLEHLRNPEDLLETIPFLLEDRGQLIVSVPNIANWTIRWSLLKGKFDYEETGILDKTHLRFYTKCSAEDLLKAAGFAIKSFSYTGRRFLPAMNAFQFIFTCQAGKGK